MEKYFYLQNGTICREPEMRSAYFLATGRNASVDVDGFSRWIRDMLSNGRVVKIVDEIDLNLKGLAEVSVVRAVRQYRAHTGCSLSEALAFVRELRSEEHPVTVAE